MKNRKRIITAIVIIAILILGVGYAAISAQTLNITGTADATASNDNFDVKFTGTPSTNAATGITVSAGIDSTDTKGRTATISVSGLTKKDQTATATYTIINNSDDLSASVAVGSITNSNNEYFEVTTNWSASKTITAGNTETITITVKLLKTPVDDETANITVPLTASAVEST